MIEIYNKSRRVAVVWSESAAKHLLKQRTDLRKGDGKQY